ncbi:annexin [Prochlorococcus marinus XMU1411]|uniref:annexin n=2 Tax=Prochlorococcus marinus TaxID=1219 RepID=UPI001ADC779C|nr:annexin [Prochlorococcus marinus]MBO8244522.1 annexin [Prochlorococcus marinus XMU1411]MBW3055584.1 annexin [Prochlorococcus marinus str. MU1411]MCR8537353.1 annexin [Prochlorococcus marinus CUG1430]
MLNFFAIVLIIFIGILLLILRKRSFIKFINNGKLHSVKLKKNRNNNNKFLSNKKSFLYNHEAKKYSLFYKNSQRNKMFSLFQGNTEDKLKALKIAEELSDKSTLSILRKGLKDMSPEVVKLSALLIRKFK